MAKPHKKKGTRAISVPAQPVSPQEAVPTRGRLWRAFAHIASTARDYTLQTFFEFLKPIVVGVVLTMLGAIFLYWNLGQAAWLYPWFSLVVAFLAGFLTLAIILVGLALLGVRRRSAKERQRINKYASLVKGPIDYAAN